MIKDEFGPSKDMDRETVRGSSTMVQEVDRVGRMADTLEFTNLALPLERFAPELLDELRAARAVVGRAGRRRPRRQALLRGAPHDPAQRVPGDARRRSSWSTPCASTATRSASSRSRTCSPATCCWRNFGVNRHGRVVFYDYDEIEYLTDCVFRAIPPAPNPEAELAEEVWYPVGPLDVFPEEFESFLLGEPRVREAFLAPPRGAARARVLAAPASGRWPGARSSTSSPTRSRPASASGSGTARY